jgi:hypothetical protein
VAFVAVALTHGYISRYGRSPVGLPGFSNLDIIESLREQTKNLDAISALPLKDGRQ